MFYEMPSRKPVDLFFINGFQKEFTEIQLKRNVQKYEKPYLSKTQNKHSTTKSIKKEKCEKKKLSQTTLAQCLTLE